MNALQRQRCAIALTSLACAFGPGGQALAQTGTAPGATAPLPGGAATERQATPRTPAAQDVRASRLIGMNVYNLQGRKLGDVNDLVIDVSGQQVHYAVLGIGGVLGMGEKLFALPMRALQVQGDRVLADLSEERLKLAPSFERKRWPDWNNPRQTEPIERFHGSGGAVGRGTGARLVRASEILGRDINDTQGGDAGEIEDLVIDLGEGRVRYAVVDFDRAWSPDDKLLALPLETLSLPASGKGDAVLQLPRERLDRSGGFNEDRWPDLNDPQFREQVERQLSGYRSGSGGQRPGASPAGGYGTPRNP